MEIVYQGVAFGVIATIGMDAWAAIAKHLLRLPTADWSMVGRWFGHMARGKFVHERIADATPVANELAIGWLMHYATGIVYGLLYTALVSALLPGGVPTLSSALLFGLVTLAAPWLVMQPGMGAGVFATRTLRPGTVRMINLSMHVVFGCGLYVGWLLIGQPM